MDGIDRSLDRHGESNRTMQSTDSDDHRIEHQQLTEFPALAALRLTADDLQKLAGQGCVCAEKRGERTYYKLRFRRCGKQVVRYIGGAERATIVKQELAMLQAESKIMRELKARMKIANKALRVAKRMMEPVLQAHGFVFHGLAIRRPRNGMTTKSSS